MNQVRKKKTKIQVKSPTQERSKQTVSHILEACARIISREGYFSVTTDKIAVEAGVSIGSLYQFFGNKESVVSALIKQLIEDDRQYFFERMKPFETLPVPERIPKMIEIGFEIYRMKPELRASLQAVRLYLTDADYLTQSRRIFAEFVRKNLPPIAPGRDGDKVAFITVTAFLSIMNSAILDTPDLVNDPSLVNEMTLMFKKYLEIC
jgi:AcrR family transcriptional regulator